MLKWTEDQVATLIEGYDAENTVASVLALMETLDKTKRQVISKLVSEKKYVAPVKVKAAPKDTGPEKKEMLRDLEATGYDTEGLLNATKPAIARVLDRVLAA